MYQIPPKIHPWLPHVPQRDPKVPPKWPSSSQNSEKQIKRLQKNTQHVPNRWKNTTMGPKLAPRSKTSEAQAIKSSGDQGEGPAAGAKPSDVSLNPLAPGGGSQRVKPEIKTPTQFCRCFTPLIPPSASAHSAGPPQKAPQCPHTSKAAQSPRKLVFFGSFFRIQKSAPKMVASKCVQWGQNGAPG